MEQIIPILLIISIGGLACMVVYAVVVTIYRLGQSALLGLHNWSSPPKAYVARVVNKRTETSGWSGHNLGHIDTYYFVTFEFRNGERREYEVSGEEFGMLVEGDQGHVTTKGSRYEYFDRAA